ncbi:mediator of RNA polymerase II transcription subunit 30-like isoform X2 [Ostrea edulis]|uniref:mediator of RNA polymerase II transcription subunit 30-like isoform X2 n=1 Tax=Ostrea edulis TaxID=37623 RepID=UPI0024AF8D2A|nr:mediator of RNA polymerase II transcription subunit 30-like isoform X2 [Ostrea edulis]
MANPGHPYGHSMMSQQGIGQQFPANTMANQQQQPQQQGTMSNQQSMMGVQQTQQGMMGIQTQGSLPQQTPQIMSPTKEINGVSMCKKGQESVQELFQRMHEVFKYMTTKGNQLPNGVNCSVQVAQDRRAKVSEQLEQLTILFKKIRLFYDSVNEICPDEPAEETLVAAVGQTFEEKFTPNAESCFKYRIGKEENRDMQLRMKNRQLKAIIDQMRTIIWEINTMIVMRKT